MKGSGKPIVILMADDDEDDRMLTAEALEESRLSNQIHFVENGEEALDYLYRRGLLDLNMPKKDGRETLREIKADPHLRRIPVVVLTTSRAECDVYRSYDLGANTYIAKPVTFDSMVEVMKVLGNYWFTLVELPPEDCCGEDN
jgi:CheY-like chemotaxis protein